MDVPGHNGSTHLSVKSHWVSLSWCFNEQGGDLADTACSDGSSCYPSTTIQL